MNEQDPKEMQKALEKDLKNYQRLDKINGSQEFNDFFQLQIETAATKMLAVFTGTGPKDWAEFCRLRGEVVAYLYPIQQIRGAKLMRQELAKQLDNFYNKQT